MKLADTNFDNSETGCCALLDPTLWDEREFDWRGKPFLKDHIRALLHVPLRFGSVISRDLNAIENAAAYPEQPIWLVDELSPWGSDVYVAVDRHVPNEEIVRLSGKFITRVFEGPYNQIGRWISETQATVRQRGFQMRKLYFFYATCPRCAKTFGVSQVVVFAQVEEAVHVPR